VSPDYYDRKIYDIVEAMKDIGWACEECNDMGICSVDLVEQIEIGVDEELEKPKEWSFVQYGLALQTDDDNDCYENGRFDR
jgi:hypothetical protein